MTLTAANIGDLFVTYDGRVVKLIDYRHNKLIGNHWRVEIDPPVPSKVSSLRNAGWGVRDDGRYCHALSDENQHKASIKEPLAYTECPY